MKNFCLMLIAFLTLSFIGNCTVNAYSIDDVKRDNPKFKIKKYSYYNDAGSLVQYRKGNFMKLHSLQDYFVTLEFNLVQFDTSNVKYVEIIAHSELDSWAFWNRLTLGDGQNAYNVYPYYKPQRSVAGGVVVTVEHLVFIIQNEKELQPWLNAKQIRLKGDEYYADFNWHPYVVPIIKKFLTE